MHCKYLSVQFLMMMWMRELPSRPASLAIVLVGACFLKAGAPTADPEDRVVPAVRAYVSAYKKSLTAILADENRHQRVILQSTPDPMMPVARNTKAEVYFAFVDSEHTWMAIRQFTSVDGAPVTDSPDLRSSLLTSATASVAATFKAFNSRFDLGRAIRNFGEPTLALELFDLSRKSRVDFERKRSSSLSGETLVTLSFREISGTDTLIRDLALESVPAAGEFTVDAITGSVRHSLLNVTLGTMSVELETTYVLNTKLELWAPSRFVEHYRDIVPVPSSPHNERRSSGIDEVLCESIYTNVRRFETTSRIKSPPGDRPRSGLTALPAPGTIFSLDPRIRR